MKNSTKWIILIIATIILVIFIYPRIMTKIEEENSLVVGWETTTDKDSGVSFQYPKTFSRKYIEAIDWPPKITILNEPFSCNQAGSETARAGVTTKIIINSKDYCVTKIVEGAAGSIYTQYAFATEKNNKLIILTFSLRAPQCDNYEELNKSECKTEQTNFDVNPIIDKIVGTMRF